MVLWLWQAWKVRELWEASHSEGDAVHNLLQSRRAQRASLRTTIYQVTRWLALVISKFPSWPQPEWVITRNFSKFQWQWYCSTQATIKGRNVPTLSGDGWLSLLSLPSLSRWQESLVWSVPLFSPIQEFKGCFTTQLTTQRPDGNSLDSRVAQGMGGGGMHHHRHLAEVSIA